MCTQAATITMITQALGVPAVLKGGAAVSLIAGHLPIHDLDFATAADGTELMAALAKAADLLSAGLQHWFESLNLPNSVVPACDVPNTAFFGGRLHPMNGTDPHRPVPVVCTYHGRLVHASGGVFKLGRLKLALRNVKHNAAIQIPFVDIVAECSLPLHTMDVGVGCGMRVSVAPKDELIDDLRRMLFRETNWVPWACAKMHSRVAKLFALLNCALMSDMLAAFYYTRVRGRSRGILSYLVTTTPASMGHGHLHGNELRVATDIEKITPGALEYDDYLGFLDAASIACIECEGYQHVVQ